MKVGVWRGEQLEALKNFNQELVDIRKSLYTCKECSDRHNIEIKKSLNEINNRLTKQTIKVGVISGILGLMSGVIGTSIVIIVTGVLG